MFPDGHLGAEVIRQQHVEKLKEFYTEANALWLKTYTIPRNISPDDYKTLVEECDAFSKRLENWVGKNMGPAALAHLLRIPSGQMPSWSSAINKDHNSELNALASLKQSIEDLITNPAWDAPLPTPN